MSSSIIIVLRFCSEQMHLMQFSHMTNDQWLESVRCRVCQSLKHSRQKHRDNRGSVSSIYFERFSYFYWIHFISSELNHMWSKLASSLPIDFIVNVPLLGGERTDNVCEFFCSHESTTKCIVCIVRNVFLNCCRCISEYFSHFVSRCCCCCCWWWNDNKSVEQVLGKTKLVTKYENISWNF